jgi:hypothetical protein
MVGTRRGIGASALLAAAAATPAGGQEATGCVGADAERYAAGAARDEHCRAAEAGPGPAGGRDRLRDVLAEVAPGCLPQFDAAYAAALAELGDAGLDCGRERRRLETLARTVE